MPTAHAADEAAIREQAYYFWEAEGRPEGREAEFWMRATVALAGKSQLDTLVKPAPKKATKPKAAAKPAPKLKAAATKTKAVPAKAEPAKKPKKK
jgi:hypothetical protein